MTGMTQPHLDPSLILLIQETHNGILDKDFIKLKLHRYPNFSTSDIYEFKMSLFDNGEPEEFLLFFRNFNVTFVTSGKLEVGVKYQYFYTLVRR